MELISESILEIVLVLIGLVITRFLVPFLKEKYTAQKVENIYDTIVKAVRAAEQIYQESGVGIELKKPYVVEYVRSKGINISEKDLDVLIESAVKMLQILEKEIKKDSVEDDTK